MGEKKSMDMQTDLTSTPVIARSTLTVIGLLQTRSTIVAWTSTATTCLCYSNNS